MFCKHQSINRLEDSICTVIHDDGIEGQLRYFRVDMDEEAWSLSQQLVLISAEKSIASHGPYLT